ncbi:YciE/YciF ferroxidase family protein [Ponticaulis profundi]|uniref:Ferritin-like domain-containing protein n=1 Tax=Ponticaulis profundi TaxID=2665222 RepID=A0ABW1SAX5_9PROT
MTISNLTDVYIDQLQDVYSANNQAIKVTEKLAEKAHNEELKEALERGAKGIREGRDVIEGILKEHDADPKGEFCFGMEGVVKEARKHALDAEIKDDDARDAVIITQYQRMAHYGIAGYGCLTAFARRLGLMSDARKIQECLDETYGGDRLMTSIAMGEVNKKAAA